MPLQSTTEASGAIRPDVAALPSRNRPCWPLVYLWLLSTVQYCYRYILQVNDASTSSLYADTPPALSAIKYAIFGVFVIYALCAFARRPRLYLKPPVALLLVATAATLLALSGILLCRVFLDHGHLNEETTRCAVQFMPWLASVFFVPMVVKDHSVRATLAAFERISFWIAFPFWTLTVVLVLLDVRYPALSYPGALVRWGGILDDPNGYACLCLLWLAICGTLRGGWWLFRLVTYLVMLACTLSFAGYATALMMAAGWLLLRGLFSRTPLRKLHIAGILAVCLSLIPLIAASYYADRLLQVLDYLYTAKSTSATAHVTELLPTELLTGSWPSLLFGSGGFSEDLYWRLLINFGVTGLAIIILVTIAWSYYAVWRNLEWRNWLGIWVAAFLIGSNGIAYLLVFPLSLLFWSILALASTKSTHDL